MATHVQISCKNGETFAMRRDTDLYTALTDLYLVLDPNHGEGLIFEAFGRSRTVHADDVAEIRIKEVE